MGAGLWEGLDLNHPMPSGAPLLAHWWQEQLNAALPQGAARRDHLARLEWLGWHLVDLGFDIHRSWNWASPDGREAELPSTLVDVFLDANHRPLIEELERRWGRPWTAEQLAFRSHPPKETDPADPRALVQPRLIFHASKSHVERVRWLLDRGVDPNLTDAGGKTALFYAKEQAMARRLLAHGASLEVTDKFRRTPLEHWAATGEYEAPARGPAKVFAVAVSTPGRVSAPVLEKALATHLIYKQPLGRWAEPMLEQLKPALTTPCVHENQTLLEQIIGRAWSDLKIHDPKLFKWLLDHTPGKTRPHVWGELAWQVLGQPDAPPRPARVKAWLRLLKKHRSDRLCPMGYVLAGARVGSALLDMLSDVFPDPCSPVGASGRKWLEVSEEGTSLMGQVMSAAADLMSGPPPRLPDVRFTNWACRWAAHHSLPPDTLEPALRLLTNLSLPALDEKEVAPWDTGQPPSPSTPEPLLSLLSTRVSLTWWINRHVSQAQPGQDWPNCPHAWARFKEVLAASPKPWKGWGVALEAQRLDAQLPATRVPPSPRLRM